jgi:signal transduction histidine kinase
MDTEAEEIYDAVCRIAAQICATPYGFVSLVGEDRVWTKAAHGSPRVQVPRDEDFCSYAILESDFLEISDTLVDERTMTSALVQGEPRFRFYAGALLRTPDGMPLGAVCVLDTVPHKLTADQRTCLCILAREVMSHFEVRRKARELELALEQARSMSEQKGELLAFIGHEIRDPLASMMGLLNLLRATPLDQEQLRYERYLEKCAQSSLLLLNDALDLSEMEAGKLILQPELMDLPAFFDDIAGLMRVQAQRKEIHFVTELPSHPRPKVLADPMRLRQILMTLLGNALKFTPTRGEVIWRARLVGETTSSESWEVIVDDTGIGLPQGINLFHPFEGEPESPHRAFGGDGLGLAVCSRLVGLMRGSISVENREGGGSRFLMTFQFARATTPTGRPAE